MCREYYLISNCVFKTIFLQPYGNLLFVMETEVDKWEKPSNVKIGFNQPFNMLRG